MEVQRTNIYMFRITVVEPVTHVFLRAAQWISSEIDLVAQAAHTASDPVGDSFLRRPTLQGNRQFYAKADSDGPDSRPEVDGAQGWDGAKSAGHTPLPTRPPASGSARR